MTKTRCEDTEKNETETSKKNKISLRTLTQLCSTFLFNGYLAGFTKGKIYRGPLKKACVPVLNCYSCPGALGSCPIGSLQNALISKKFKGLFYVTGILFLFGLIFGRFICGFLCPFGFLQDALYKIKVRKITISDKRDAGLKRIKYAVLLIFAVLLPLVTRTSLTLKAPWFCKYICPAGTAEGGIPLVLFNSDLRRTAGALFNWKVLLLVLFIVSSVKISRPFCKYICPLGALYGLFNKISLIQLDLNREKCVHCSRCENVCPMQVHCRDDINSKDCIRCLKCVKECPVQAIKVVKPGSDKTARHH